MNRIIIENLNKLVKQAKAEYLNAQVENNEIEIANHKHRVQALSRVLGALASLDFEITSIDDVKGIPGIGPGTIKRIKEILETGTLKELKNKYDKKKQTKIDSIQELEQIIGVGPSSAKRMVLRYGIKSVDDLKKAIKNGKIKVNRKILLGLKYYNLVQGNIPRKEIESIEKYLIKQTLQIDDKLEIMICGSYRRGKKTSGDVDVLMYHPSAKTMKQILQPENYGLKSYLDIYVDKLTKNGFLLDDMTDKNYNIKYMGFCRYKNNPVRRIDIRYIPYNSLPTAMLYFTGPYELNTAMRIAAKKRGMILNEYGLFYVDDNGVRTTYPIKSEADVFKALGMDYLTPEKREKFSTGKNIKIKD